MPGLVLAADKGKQWLRWEYVTQNQDRIVGALEDHVKLTLIAVGLGLLISLPLGWLAWRRRRLATVILGIEGALYTIPSVALFAILLPFTGFTYTTAEIALVSYTLLILTRNIVAGLDSVPSDVREAARGMGMRPGRQLLTIELPIAMPAIMAGIRLATVSTIGLVTVTAVIAQRSLGQLINDGINIFDRTPVVVGGGLSVILAVVADVLLIGVERLVAPWTRRTAR